MSIKLQIYWPSSFSYDINRNAKSKVIGLSLLADQCLHIFVVLSIIPTSNFKGLRKNNYAHYEMLGDIDENCEFHCKNKKYEIIIFAIPNMRRMQFYSLRPIELSVEKSFANGINNSEIQNRQFDCENYAKLQSLCLQYNKRKDLDFQKILNKLNLYELQLKIFEQEYQEYKAPKRNVLRKRVDKNHFPLDVLLMGILIFIILVFLLPTVSAFYLSYSAFEMFVITIEVWLETIVMLLNHFPLFVLMLKIKEPSRVPGGILFKINNKRTSNFCDLELKSTSLSVSLMFKNFSKLTHELSSEYFSIRTLKNIISGDRIYVNRNQLYVMLYSSLPPKVIGISELRKLLRVREASRVDTKYE
ncbi:phosphatidylinositol N-acetylglucosaminyltransferase SCDLUD_004511 [Saccharomycodes ludwigii]|uniref:phosphatidylinositol N-acetylglucosaminyltransferase n=1 Tax=Saccharomycodes ludwigii TaxID=36035 RepID=UPI001E87B5BD|nr:hypothetical protein SCDLUD_004511 [Saccharomycodes ludwigii]KAH3899087.1 hypothetical protein SCDLUD_004511 [Saccharomycodes ludwigii]